MIEARAAAQRRDIETVTYLCEGAFQAVSSGDTDTHDRLVREGLLALMDRVDVIVLAQASMARVVDTLSEDEKTVPILSSPKMGVEAAKQVIESLA